MKTTSAGICIFCSDRLSMSHISRHLAAHLTKKTGSGKKGRSWLISVKVSPQWGSTPYALFLWIDGNALFGDIDDFLRAIWLECCGHLSAFRIAGKQNSWDFFEAEKLLAQSKTAEYEALMENAMGEIPKSRKAQEVMRKGMKIEYEYDFGSSTNLQLAVVAEYPVKAEGKVVLLSRNEPPEIPCEKCRKNKAVTVCSVCTGYKAAFFCRECGKKHAKTCRDFAGGAGLPVVNSPRMGVCGYTGGTIDMARDLHTSLRQA